MLDSLVATVRVGHLSSDGQTPLGAWGQPHPDLVHIVVAAVGGVGPGAPMCPRPAVAAMLLPLQTGPEGAFQPL